MTHENKAQLDSEYTALMAELGETTSAPIQIATPSMISSIGNNQMATHGVGGADILQAIEYNPEKGTKAGGKLNKDELVDDLENGNWDPKNYGYAGGDYTTGQADLAASQQPLAFRHIGDKKQKRLTEKDINQESFNPEIMMEVNGQPIFKNQLMRAQETEEVDKYLQNKTFRNQQGNLAKLGDSTGNFSAQSGNGGIRRVIGQPGNSQSKPGIGFDKTKFDGGSKDRQMNQDKNAYGFVAEGGGRKINYAI